MSERLPETGRPAPSDRTSHHIAAIAHLFIDDDEAAGGTQGRRRDLRLAIACCDDSRIAAFAAGALVAESRQLVAAGERRAVRLVEEADLKWSAGAYLALDGLESGTISHREPGQWTWAAEVPDGRPPRLVCWTHLSDERQNPRFAPAGNRPGPGHDGLILCLLAHEVGGLAAGVRLGRLLGQLIPRRLEILVFPDSWSPGGRRPPGEQRWFGRLTGNEAELLHRCRELTRALRGICPVTITNLPADGSPNASANTVMILQKTALRLIADFWVDPGS